MDVVDLPLAQIIPYARNPRRNAQAIATVAASIQEFGWRQPIVVDEAMVVLAGHTRLEAARKLGLKTAPVQIAKGLSVSQARAFRIMDTAQMLAVAGQSRAGEKKAIGKPCEG
jgi:ParB-like chromosome segregation protein Spo0J